MIKVANFIKTENGYETVIQPDEFNEYNLLMDFGNPLMMVQERVINSVFHDYYAHNLNCNVYYEATILHNIHKRNWVVKIDNNKFINYLTLQIGINYKNGFSIYMYGHLSIVDKPTFTILGLSWFNSHSKLDNVNLDKEAIDVIHNFFDTYPLDIQKITNTHIKERQNHTQLVLTTKEMDVTFYNTRKYTVKEFDVDTLCAIVQYKELDNFPYSKYLYFLPYENSLGVFDDYDNSHFWYINRPSQIGNLNKILCEILKYYNPEIVFSFLLKEEDK